MMRDPLRDVKRNFLTGVLVGGCGCLAVTLVAPASVAQAKTPAPVKVTLNQISADGVGAAIGTITIKQTKTGVELATDLTDLAPGEHGFHLHEKASCDPGEKDGKKAAGIAAGAHWDPDATKAHKGPGGGGHKGDLPKLVIPEAKPNAKTPAHAKLKLPIAGLTLADFAGRAFVIHGGGDNYADAPKPLGGGGERVACGVIPGEPAAAAAPAAGAAPAAAAPAAGAAAPAKVAAPAAPAAAAPTK